MLGAIKYGLRKLFDPSGRDARQTFWYFVLFVVILRFAASMVVTIPMMVTTIGDTVAAVKNGADPATIQQQTNAAMIAMMPRFMWLGIIVGVASMLLLVTSVVRRLHDSDLSGWLVLVPMAIQAYAMTQVPAQMAKAIDLMEHLNAKTPPNPVAMMQGQGAAALIAWLPALIVVGIGIRASTPGPNRYGTEPVRF
jgi:uncharacterized membrane protein YhaH (DUF805 family)